MKIAAYALALVAIATFSNTSSAQPCPEKNLNYIYTEPLFNRTWGPPLLHILVVGGFIAVVIYWPTHLLLQRLFGAHRIKP